MAPDRPDNVAVRPTTVAVLLAAGAATRFEAPTHKLDAVIDGRSVLGRAIDAAVSSAVGPVLVVVSGDETRPVATDVSPAVAVVNARWREGAATSLRAGLDAAAARGADRAVVALGDQPFLAPAAWRAVAASDAPIAVATYAGRRGHPVGLRASVWPLLPRTGDEGARVLMRLRPDLVREVPCEGPGLPLDVDTVEDLRRWQKSW